MSEYKYEAEHERIVDGYLKHMSKLEFGKDEEPHFDDGAALAALLNADVCFLNSFWWEDKWPKEAQNKICVAVNCNQIFFPGADADRLDFKDIEDLYDHWIKDPNYGAAAWCIKQRNQEPMPDVRKAMERAGIWDIDSLLRKKDEG